VIALFVFLVYIITSLAIVALRDNLGLSWYLMVLFTIVTTSLQASIVFVIVLRNKQGLASIGLHKEKIFSAIRLGLLFSLIPITFIAIIPGIVDGFNEIQIGAILVSFVTTFFFAAHEDVIFVGFIQTRLYGFFKTDKAAITIGAILFAAMHIPPWLMMGRFNTDNLIVSIALNSIGWVLMYFVLVSVFKKYYSLVSVFILHTLANFSWNFPQSVTVFGTDISLVWVVLIVLSACILYSQTNKQSRT